jgi:hypothetical protein
MSILGFRFWICYAFINTILYSNIFAEESAHKAADKLINKTDPKSKI